MGETENPGEETENQKKFQKRLDARKEVQDFFWGKRDALKTVKDRYVRRLFLAEMNGIARDLEIKAMGLADTGKSWEAVLKEAEDELGKLKKEFVERLGGDDPVIGAPNRESIRELRSI